jgi:hypothetical protein
MANLASVWGTPQGHYLNFHECIIIVSIILITLWPILLLLCIVVDRFGGNSQGNSGPTAHPLMNHIIHYQNFLLHYL